MEQKSPNIWQMENWTHCRVSLHLIQLFTSYLTKHTTSFSIVSLSKWYVIRVALVHNLLNGHLWFGYDQTIWLQAKHGYSILEQKVYLTVTGVGNVNHIQFANRTLANLENGPRTLKILEIWLKVALTHTHAHSWLIHKHTTVETEDPRLVQLTSRSIQCMSHRQRPAHTVNERRSHVAPKLIPFILNTERFFTSFSSNTQGTL